MYGQVIRCIVPRPERLSNAWAPPSCWTQRLPPCQRLQGMMILSRSLSLYLSVCMRTCTLRCIVSEENCTPGQAPRMMDVSTCTTKGNNVVLR